MQTDKFQNGETIYDVDGNAYTVRDGSAHLKVEGSAVSYPYVLDDRMAACFSRTNPKAKASA